MLTNLRDMLLPIVENQRYSDTLLKQVAGASVGIIGAGPGVRTVPETIGNEHTLVISLNGAAHGLPWTARWIGAAQWDPVPWVGHTDAPWAIVSDRAARFAPRHLPLLIFPHELPVPLNGCLPRTVLALRVMGADRFTCYGCDAILGKQHLARYDKQPGSLCYYRQQEAASWAALGAPIEWRHPSGPTPTPQPRTLAWESGP